MVEKAEAAAAAAGVVEMVAVAEGKAAVDAAGEVAAAVEAGVVAHGATGAQTPVVENPAAAPGSGKFSRRKRQRIPRSRCAMPTAQRNGLPAVAMR